MIGCLSTSVMLTPGLVLRSVRVLLNTTSGIKRYCYNLDPLNKFCHQQHGVKCEEFVLCYGFAD